jgi:hypothetical protein
MFKDVVENVWFKKGRKISQFVEKFKEKLL